MFGSTIVDVAIAVVFGFLAISLFTSALMESVNSLFDLRARNLKQGVAELVNDSAFAGLARQLYSHALVNPLGPGDANPLKNKPSYINSEHFASALLDILKLSSVAPTLPQLQGEIDKIEDRQLKQYLTGVLTRANGDLTAMKKEIADWFDAAMDRLSGRFKRWRQLWSFVIALAGAALFNLDSIGIARTVWTNPALVQNLQASSIDNKIAGSEAEMQAAVRAVTELMQSRLPAGWQPQHMFQLRLEDGGDWMPFYDAPISVVALLLLGWIVTAFSALFGAPFWFDALQSIVQIRGSGPTPNEAANAKADAG